jgi:hypothetical protein
MDAITAYSLAEVQKGTRTKWKDAMGKRDTSFEFIIYQLRRTALIQILLLLRPAQVSSKLTLSRSTGTGIEPGSSVQEADAILFELCRTLKN